MSRAKRDFLADRGTKELRIGILEHKAHALMEPLGNRGILEICRIDRMPVKQIRARVHKFKAVDKAHDRRLAAAIGTKQGNELAAINLQRNAIDHRMSCIGKHHVAQLNKRRSTGTVRVPNTHRAIYLDCQNVAFPYPHRPQLPCYSAAHSADSSSTTPA